MTKIRYECRGSDGTLEYVTTLQEAKDYVAVHGGTYEIQYSSTLSDTEGFARKGHRAGGKQQGIKI